jgi:hypothetical protein
MNRSPEAVLQDHLERRCNQDLEGDLAANSSDKILVISKDGVLRGKDGIRHTADILAENSPMLTSRI